MLATESPQLGSATIPTKSCPRIRLRLSCPGVPERFFELPIGKTTVGSSPRCNVRIAQAGVHPVHCLVFTDEQGVTVRRWAADSLVNGMAFDESALNVGDVLSIGSVDLQAIDATFGNGLGYSHEASLDHCDLPTSDLITAAETQGQTEPAEGTAGQWDRPTECRSRTTPVTSGACTAIEASSSPDHPTVPVPATTVADQKGQLSATDLSFVANVEQVLSRLRNGCIASRARSRKLIASLRHERDTQRNLMAQVAMTEERLQLAGCEQEAVAAKLNETKFQLADAQCRVRELESLSAEHQQLVVTHSELANEKTELESQVQRLASEQIATAAAQQALAAENTAYVAECQRLAEENTHLLNQLASTKADQESQIQRFAVEQAAAAEAQHTLATESAAFASECQRLAEENTHLFNQLASTKTDLEGQIQQFAVEQAAAAEAQHTLATESAAFAAESQRLAEENTHLFNQLAGAKADLEGQIQRFAAEQAVMAGAHHALAAESAAFESECQRLAEENTRLLEGTAKLNEDCAAFVSERERLEESNAQVQAEIANLRREKDLVSSQNGLLTSDIQSHIKERERIRQENTQAWDKIAHLTAENKALVDSNSNFAEESEQFRAELDRLHGDAASWAAIKQGLDETVVALTSERDRLAQENASSHDALGQLSQNFLELERERSTLSDERDRLRQDFAQSENEIARLRQEKDSLITNNSELNAEQARLRQENSLAWDKIVRLSEENEALAETGPEVFQELEQFRQESDRLHIETTRLSSDVARLSDEHRAAVEARDQFILENNKLRDEIAQAVQETTTLNSRNAELNLAYEHLQAENERQRHDLSLVTDELARVSGEQSSLVEEHTKLNSALKDEQDHRATLEKRQAEVAEALQQQLEESQRDNDRLQGDIARLSSDTARLISEHDEAIEASEKFSLEINNLRAEVAQAIHETATLKDQCAEQNAAYEQLQAENTQQRDDNSLLRDELARVSGEKASLIEEHKTLAEALNGEQQHRETLEKLQQELSIALASQREVADALQLQLKDSQHNNDHLQAESARLTEEHRAVVEDRDKILEENNRLRNEIAQAIQETTGASGERGELVERHEQLLAASVRQRDDIARMHDELARMTGEKAALIEEQKLLFDALSEERRLREALQEVQGDDPDSLASRGEPADALQLQLEDSRRDLVEARELISQLESELNNRKQEASNSTAKINELELSLLTQSNQLASAVAALEKVEERLREEQPRSLSARSAHDNLEAGFSNEELIAPLSALSAWQQDEFTSTSDESSAEAGKAASSARPASVSIESSETEIGLLNTDQTIPMSSLTEVGRGNVVPAVVVPETTDENSLSTSFLDRYAHLFETADAEVGSVTSSSSKLRSSTLANSSADREAPTALDANATYSTSHDDPHDDEESIEQYMAKLLQRVRGDAISVREPQTSLAPPAPQLAKDSSIKSLSLPQVVQMQKLGPDEAVIQVPTPNLEEFMRKSTTLGPSVDIEAFRALANESARHAIGVHATQKHRREALTQMVVATLTGLTGVWLMWGASEWLDGPFISGCFILIVGAYFSGQTIRTLWDSVQAGKHHRNEEVDISAAEQYPQPLPIDVEYPKP